MRETRLFCTYLPIAVDMDTTDSEVNSFVETAGVEEMKNRGKWYGDAADYWKSVPATVEGMLGGYGKISATDVLGSKIFLDEFVQKANRKKTASRTSGIPSTKSTIALDCGAGIGRVSKHLLMPLFDIVDLVEQNAEFLDKAKTYLGEKKDRGHFFPIGLQEFEPKPGRYNVIWCQWVSGHLTDKDFVSFFKRCEKGLAKDGVIVVKENITRENVDIDSQDSSVTRSDEIFKQLFSRTGLALIKEQVQKHFPSEIYRVKMYALAPAAVNPTSG